MKVLIIGATGRVGSLLVKELVHKGHEVFVGTRNTENTTLKKDHVTPIYLDLLSDAETISDSMPPDTGAIFFVSGSRGKSLLQVDLHGAVKTMQAAESKGIKRYIMLSSTFALQPERWNKSVPGDLTDYYIAKHYADQWLVNNTALDYTILQPGSLKEEKGSGKIKVNVDASGQNAIENVALTLAAVLEYPSTIGKVITMHDGETPIEEAIRSV